MRGRPGSGSACCSHASIAEYSVPAATARLARGAGTSVAPDDSAGTAVGSGPCCSVEAAADQGCLSNGLVAALISISVLSAPILKRALLG